MKKDFAYILDECIDRVMKGEAVESVLSEYPDSREELESLLRTALDINGLPEIVPSSEYINLSKTTLLREICQLGKSGKDSTSGIFSLSYGLPAAIGNFWQNITTAKRWSIAVTAVLIIVLFATLGQFVFLRPSTAMASACVLRVLSGEVGISNPESDKFHPANDGMTLTTGTQVKTGENSHALITFFDGSTIKLEPDTVLEITNLENDEGKSPIIILKQWLGKTWSRVIKMIDPGSRFEIETPSATAIVRGTLFTTDVTEQGDTTVSTTEGLVSVAAEDEEVFVEPNHKTNVSNGKKPSEPLQIPEPVSEITITITGAAVGSINDPTGSSTGSLPDGTDFNQISGSTSSSPDAETQVITLSEPADGNYTLALRYLAEGTADYHIQGTLNGEVVLNYSGSLDTGKESGYLINFDLAVTGESINIEKVKVKLLDDNSPEKIGQEKFENKTPPGKNKSEEATDKDKKESTPAKDKDGDVKENNGKDLPPGKTKTDEVTGKDDKGKEETPGKSAADDKKDNGEKSTPPGQDKTGDTSGDDGKSTTPPGQDKSGDTTGDDEKNTPPGQDKSDDEKDTPPGQDKSDKDTPDKGKDKDNNGNTKKDDSLPDVDMSNEDKSGTANLTGTSNNTPTGFS